MCNQGTHYSPLNTVRVSLSADEILDGSDQLIAELPVSGLTKGACVEFVNATTDLRPGNFHLISAVDPANAVTELLESNNEFVSDIMTLTIDLSPIWSITETETEINITLAVINLGNLVAPPTALRLQASADETADLSDLPLRVENHLSIAPGPMGAPQYHHSHV